MMKSFLLYCSRQDWVKRGVLAVPLSARLARRFMAGETLDEALAAVREVNGQGMRATIDHLGEHVCDPAEALRARDIYLQALQRIRDEGLDCNVSLKLSELGQDIDDALALENVEPIIRKAQEVGNFVRVDMEGSAYTQRTLDAFGSLRARYECVGIVVQSYLFRTMQDVPDVLGRKATMRLCKGAYDEPPEVAYLDKEDTDDAFRKLTTMLLESRLAHGIATHDEAMIRWTLDEVARLGLGPDHFEFQMLYGVRRDLQARLVADGWKLRIYVPFGENWYPYFTRRLAERPANMLFVLRNVLRG